MPGEEMFIFPSVNGEVINEYDDKGTVEDRVFVV
jgi:hypothetical protein